jgi:hypothetical protein
MDESFARIGNAARARFPRWDPAMWIELEDVYLALAAKLPIDDRSLASWAELAAEGIGQGLLFPDRAGANFLNRAWQSILPSALPTLPPADRAKAISMCWNLGENLAAAPTWVKRLFERRLYDAHTLDAIESIVQRTVEHLGAPDEPALGTSWKLLWVHIGASEPDFLPGAVCMLAPLVACVRARGGDAAIAVLCTDPPEILGRAQWPAAPDRELPSQEELDALRTLDRRVTEVHDATRGAHRVVATLTTSQMLVVARPT